MSKLRLLHAAWRELLGTYREKWRASWAERALLERPPRRPDEAEFLPAALAVQDTPASPAAHWILRLIILATLLGLLAACLFEIDIVVSAPGTITPVGRVQAIQTLEAGVVRHVAVHEGQHVRAGEVLAELFSPGINTDAARLMAEHEAARTELARLDALAARLSPLHAPQAGSSAHQAAPTATGNTLLDAHLHEIMSKQARAEADIARRTAELVSASESLEKIRATLPRLETKVDDYRALEADGYVSRHALLDQQQQLADARADERILASRQHEARALLAEARQTLASTVAEARRGVFEQQRDARLRLSNTEQELAKYRERDALMVLRSPVDGEVSHLSAYTIGGVFPAAQTLMNVVPDSQRLEVEAIIENKDVGHLRTGQAATIKIESYPFTQYGTLKGSLSGLTATAAKDEKKGLVYSARISLPDTQSASHGWPGPLIAGMTAMVEVHIGTRRVISYFLSPLVGQLAEAIHER